MFPAPHPYAHASAGSPATVLGLSLADARTFAAAWYRPDNSSLHLVGDLAPDASRAAVWRAFPDPAVGVPEGTARRACPSFAASGVPVPRTPLAADLLVHKAPVRKPWLVAAWAVPGGWTGASRAEDPLVATLEDRLWLAAGVIGLDSAPGCGRQEFREGSIVRCAFELRAGTEVKPLQRAVETALENLDSEHDRREWLGPRWSNAVLFRFGQVAADAEALVAPLAEGSVDSFLYSHFRGDPRYHHAVWEALSRTSYDDVAPYAREWFTPARTVWSLIEPGGVVSTDAPAAHAGAGALPAEASPTTDRVRAAAAWSGAPIATRTLPNGLRIVAVPFGEVPLLGMDVLFAGGHLAGDAPGALDMAEENEVWRPRNAGFDVNEDSLRAALRTTLLTGPDSAGWRYFGPSGNLAEMLWLLESRLRGSEQDDRQEDVAQQLGARLGRELDYAPALLRLLTRRAMFADPMWLYPAGYRAWRTAMNAPERQARDLLRGLRQASNTTLIVVGKQDPEATFAAVASALGAWPVPKAAAAPRAWVAPELASPGETLSLVHTPGAASARVTGACRIGGGVGDPAAAAAERLAAAQLFAALRVRSGLSYDPQVGVAGDVVTGNIRELSARVPPSSIDTAIAAIRAVVDELGALADDGTARRGALAAARSDALDRATIRGMLRALWQGAQAGEVSTWFDTQAAALAAVDAAAVRAVIGDCAARIRWGVAGDPEAIRPALERARLPRSGLDVGALRRELSGE